MAPTRKTGRASRRAGSPPPPISRTQPQMFRACSPVRERVRGRSDTGALSLSDLGSVGGGLLAALGGRGARDSEGSAGTLTGSDEEGIRLLRQQLSAVKRIRMEHERKDAVIAALQVEVSKLSRDREEAVALQHECDGMRVRLAGLEKRCRQLETAERDSSHRWARKEDTWRAQIRDADNRLQAAQEQTREERDRAERLAAAKANLEPALAAAEARAKTAKDTAAREHAERGKAELRATNVEGVLDAGLEEERAKVRDLEEKMSVLKKEITVSRDEVESLAPRMKNLEEVNDALRNRCSEAELELVQLNVYRPLVERADLIDRRRTEAEEGLRAAEAELGREKASSEAAKRNAAELQAALDRHGARLAKAEFEASKALSLERDLFSLTRRLEVAETDKENASRARRSDEEAHRAVAAALEELVDLAAETMPRQQKTPPVPTERALPKEGGGAALATGGVAGTYGARWEPPAETSTLVTRLAEIEARMRRRAAGKDVGDESVDKEGCGVGKGSLRGGDDVDGGAELSRAVRAVRALVESVASVVGDRDRCVDEVVRARAESRSLGERVEALLREKRSSAKALQNASASRSALLSRLRDAQVSRLAAEAAAEKARSELSDVRHFLANTSETLSRRTEKGTGDSEGSLRSNSSAFTKTSPTEHRGNWGAVSKRPSNARLISDVSAGVKGLLVARSAAADTIRGLENRCCRTEKQLEELHSLARDRDAVHGEQLTALRNRCGSELDTLRQAEKAAQGTAKRALRDLAVASKKISAFEKKQMRISSRVADVNDRLSALSAEASAAMAGLRLLARACAPLIERCRLLATQRRLLARLSVDYAPIIRASTLMAEPDIDASHLMDVLRALVATLDRCNKRKKADARCGEWQADAGRRESGGGEAVSEKVCENRFRETVVPTPSYRPPLVSLRAVGIAAVAARRLVRLAVHRASRRAASTQEMTRSPIRRIEQPGCSPCVQRESSNHHDCGGNDVIPLGPLGGTGGVSMLCEADISFVLPATVLARAEASDGGQSAAERCLGLLDMLVRCRGSDPGERGSGEDGEDEEPSLLQVLVRGQAGHWRRLEQRGLVPARRLASWGSCSGGALRGSHRGTDRIILGRIARHYGNEWMAWRRRIMRGESLKLMGATRRGVSALARCVEDAERRFAESEARRHRAGTESSHLMGQLEVALETAKELRTELDKKCEMASFFEERVHILEREAAGTVPVEAFSSTEKALAESLAEVEKWRVRSASLEAELEEALDTKKATRRARRGAEIAYKEQAVRAQLQDELLSLRSYVLRSEQAVQELQEEARRQASETGRRGYSTPLANTVESSGCSSWD